MRNMILCTALCMSAAWSANAADTMPPVTERFAAADVAETPDFQKHVVPLFGRLGCNGRACHGSFQGRGGFRLSLFGYDFKADHEALLDEESPRMVAGKPEESLIVTKPTSDDEHEGGMRYERGSWEHHLIRNWIKGGAEYSGVEEKLVELDVEPKEIVFQGDDFESKLTVTAVWSSGKREDVTPLCRFQSNDDLVISIDENGSLKGGQPGDTHLVVFYDKAVVPIPVMRPVTDLVGDKYPKVAANTPVDQHVLNKLKKLGVAPSETCDDATFVRRVTLDLTGTLPSSKDVVAFLEDKSPNKRAAKIDELLKTKAYAAWWTTKLCDFTGNNDQQLVNLTPQRTQAAQQWYDWIYQRVESNVSYDKLVEGIVLGRSRQPGQSYKEYCEDMCDMYRDGASFAEQPTMPYYWARREFRNPPERAISFAYSFLGIRIQCAQCHKHPFDQWSKDDFDKFTGFFAYARSANNGGDNDARKQYNEMIKALDLGDKRGNQVRREFPRLIKEGKTVPLPEVYVQQARKPNANSAANNRRRPAGNQPVSARLLGGEELTLADYEDARQPLMDWLRNENELFAKAFVNRVWANYFNRGIVEPPDDLSLANPPCNQELLDYLAEGFVANKYDMHWLHREILNSDTYQRSWKPNDSNRKDSRNFSHAIPRRLPAEVAYDAIMVATASEANAAEACNVLDRRAIAIPGASARNNGNGNAGYALQVFGRSTRESSCDCDRSMDATLLQTVYLRNDRDMLSMLESRNGWLSEVAKSMGVRFNGAAAPDNGANAALARRARQLRTQLQQVTARRAKLVKAEGEDSKAVVALDRRIKQAQGQLKAISRRLNPKSEAAPAEETKVAAKHDPKQMQEVVDQLYLRTLSRYPSDAERDRALTYLADYENPVDGLRGLMWAVVNTKEFIVNH